jgi:Mce-associated membrane protein
MRWLVTALVGLLAAVFVALAGAGGSLYWDRVERRSAEQAREELGPLAGKQVPAIFGYDYQTVERSLDNAYSMFTPEFRRQFQEKAKANIIPQARDRQMVSQVNVVGFGVMAAHRNSGSVMVYINQTWIDKSRQPLYNGSRIKVDYQRLDGRWLINSIEVL